MNLGRCIYNEIPHILREWGTVALGLPMDLIYDAHASNNIMLDGQPYKIISFHSFEAFPHNKIDRHTQEERKCVG